MNSSPKFSKRRALFYSLMENGLFWMALVLLSIGAVTTFYCQNYAVSGPGPSHIFVSRGKTLSRGANQPISHIPTDRPWVSLTFDVTGDGREAEEIADILKNCRVSAAFFVSKDWIDAHPDGAARLVFQGHELGGRDEASSAGRTDQETRRSMQKLYETIAEISGQTSSFYRFPAQDYSSFQTEIAASLNYFPISWSVDSLDWKDYGAESISDSVLNHRELKNGAIILFRTGSRYTPQALESLISGLRQKGYEPVPLSKLLSGG